MHDLRNVGDIKAKKVLVVGGGFGGVDLVWQLLFGFPDNFETLYFSGKVSHLQTSEELTTFLSSCKLVRLPMAR